MVVLILLLYWPFLLHWFFLIHWLDRLAKIDVIDFSLNFYLLHLPDHFAKIDVIDFNLSFFLIHWLDRLVKIIVIDFSLSFFLLHQLDHFAKIIVIDFSFGFFLLHGILFQKHFEVIFIRHYLCCIPLLVDLSLHQIFFQIFFRTLVRKFFFEYHDMFQFSLKLSQNHPFYQLFRLRQSSLTHHF